MQRKISSDSEHSEIVDVIPVSMSIWSINTFILPMGYQNKGVENADINESSCQSYLNNRRYGNQNVFDLPTSLQGAANLCSCTENCDNIRGVETDTESTSEGMCVFCAAQDDDCLHKGKFASQEEFKTDDSGISLS